jgi:hypothetical protein
MGGIGTKQQTRVVRWPSRWAGLPVWARWALAVYVIGFVEGTGSHLLDLATRGVHAYDRAVWPTQVLWYSLVVLDALVVWLALLARPAVVPSGVAIMAADLVANWNFNWSAIRADPGLFWAPVGLLPMSLFGVFVMVAGMPLWRLLRHWEPWEATPDIS